MQQYVHNPYILCEVHMSLLGSMLCILAMVHVLIHQCMFSLYIDVLVVLERSFR